MNELFIFTAAVSVFIGAAYIFEKVPGADKLIDAGVEKLERKKPCAATQDQSAFNKNANTLKHLYYSEMFKKCQMVSEKGGEKVC